jgi:hypothetical protein
MRSADEEGRMDPLVSGVINFQQATMASQVQYAVARKMMDNQQMQGAAIVKLINAAANGPAKAGDALVAAATGLGGSLDVTA